MKPISADAVNEILAQPNAPVLDTTEREEREVKSVASEMIKAVGVEVFQDMTLRLALAFEAQCRAQLPVDSLTIRQLDEYHRING